MVESGILTSTQRESIRGEPEKTDSEREMRQRIRNQVYNAFTLDGPVLFEELRDTDREQIFRSRERKPGERAKSTSEERKEKLKESLDLQPGIACLMAFFYTGLEERPKMGDGSFEATLKNAMGRIANQNGWVLEEFEFDVKFNKEPELDVWHERFEAGDATIGEALELSKQDKITKEEFTEYVDKHLD